MTKKSKQILLFIAFGVTLYVALMNLSVVLLFVQNIISLIFPILLGLILAFMLSVPMRGFEKLFHRFFSRMKRPPKDNLIRGASLILTLSSIVLVIALAITFAVPALRDSVMSIVPLLKAKWPQWAAYLNNYHIDLPQVQEWLTRFDWKSIFGGANILLDSVVDVAATTISGITNTVFALVIAIYVLLSKNVLAAQLKKLLDAHLTESAVKKICSVSVLIRDTYAKFLSGQCMEAVILGSLIFIAYSLFGLPYAGLIAFLTGLFAFIPYVGALAACVIGAFLILLAAPSKVILCIVVYLVVQFIETQFIYPHVVGTSVGLSPLWTLIAALVGGKLFGLVGIIFFIPLVAVLYTLVREDTAYRLQNRRVTEKTVNENTES